MTFLNNLLLASAVLAAVVITPTAAHAIEVECSSEDGSSCTVDNDPFDSVTCTCADLGGTGTSGGSAWAGFDEEMLLEVCESQLSICEGVDTEGEPTTTSAGTIGTEGTTVGETIGDTEGDTEGDTDFGTTGYVGTGTTGDYGGESTGYGSSSTGSVTSAGSGPSTDPAETTGSSASGGDDGPAETSGNDSAPSGDSGSSSGGADEASEDPSGCSVDAGGPSGGALMALFGLVLGLRRRRVRRPVR